jgi:hypothetical protein
MNALANCKAALMVVLETKSDAKVDELKCLVALTRKKLDTEHTPAQAPTITLQQIRHATSR